MPEQYVELHARSAFSFLRGASLPEQLAERSVELALPAMALCDRNGLYGAPRFYAAAREHGIRPIIGCELTMKGGAVLPVLVENQRGYQNLCALLSCTHLRSPKGEFSAEWDELAEHSEGLIALTGDHEGPLQNTGDANAELHRLVSIFGSQKVFVEIQRHHLRGEKRTNAKLMVLADRHDLPLLATNGVLHATRVGRQVTNMFACLRHHTQLDSAGKLLSQNDESRLKSATEMAALFHDLPGAITNTQQLADRLDFKLEDLGYEFPSYETPDGTSMDEFLRRVTLEGAHRRYGARLSRKVLLQLRHELNLIEKLGFAGYFLIVWDLIRFCDEAGIMVQGRGSAANSAVCFCLGITAVDSVGCNLLFERFLSEGRQGWPDIDIDLPSKDRRERVIQEVYNRYGRHGACMVANVISYRGRSAAREVGKVLGLSENLIERFSALFASGDFPHTLDFTEQLQSAGIPLDHPRTPAFVSLYKAVYGLPRHLGQHPGGMIVCQGKLSRIVPLENATMPGRTICQWDKEDCEDLRLVKVDLLGLGMMAVLQETVALCRERGNPVDLATIPKDDSATFDLMCRADTIGVFQIESRAQQATLPRMQPRCFYDTAIQVAIIRPGPIQGDLVHPFLARRMGKEPITYYDERLRPILERTLGVPLFQEQLLKIAMVMADFTGSEAEELRRALSFHRSAERMARVTAKLRERMTANRVSPENIDRIVRACSSFALYGFPESHAHSFALLAYGSAWLKVHRCAEFFCSLLNCQPMGFYSPATLLQDAKRHGLNVRAVCIVHSEWLCTLEDEQTIRLGFCSVRKLRKLPTLAMIAERALTSFASIHDLKKRVSLRQDEFRMLAELGALNALAGHRRDALWQVERQLLPEDDLFARVTEVERMAETSPLLAMTPGERLQADYRAMGLSTGRHPMAHVRERLPEVWKASDLRVAVNGSLVIVAGAVICRQRPGTAHGILFISLEDETGITNVIVSAQLFESNRLMISQEPYLRIEGIAQVHESVLHIRAQRLQPLLAPALASTPSHDFH